MEDSPNASMPRVEPLQQHRWLHAFLGEWEFEGEGTAGPDTPPVTFRGTESVRSLGGLWIVAEGRSQMPGCGDSTTVMTLGYDPAKAQFVGTFVASMMTHMWVYEGALDEGGRVLTLDTVGPDLAVPGKTARYQDVIELESDAHRILTSRMLGEDGTWRVFMTAHYRRKP